MFQSAFAVAMDAVWTSEKEGDSKKNSAAATNAPVFANVAQAPQSGNGEEDQTLRQVSKSSNLVEESHSKSEFVAEAPSKLELPWARQSGNREEDETFRQISKSSSVVEDPSSKITLEPLAPPWARQTSNVSG